MDTLVSDQSSPMTYTNRFCVAMLAVFATCNPSEAALTVLSAKPRNLIPRQIFRLYGMCC